MAEETKQENIIEELEGLPEEIEDIEKHPILKPLLDYNKTASMLAKEDESESEYLTNKIKEWDELINTGIYEDSSIAIKSKAVTEVYQRILLIMTRYTEMADKKIVEMKRIVEKHYIPKREHEKILDELRKDIKKEETPKKETSKKTEQNPKPTPPTPEEIEKDNQEAGELFEEK